MPGQPWVALAILVLTYVLLTLRGVPRLKLKRHRPIVAVAGGGLMVLTGSLSLEGAARAVNLEILALLFGMLTLAASLEVCGFFDWLSHHVVRRATTQRVLLGWVMLVSAVFSALILNDAVVLLFTPVLVKACRLMRVGAMPYLAGACFAANIGSVATEVGNPQNAFIAVQSGLGFLAFAAALLPLAALSLGLSAALLVLLFRRSLAQPLDKAGLAALPPEVVQPRLLRASLLVLAAAFAGFAGAQALGVSIALVAFAAGLAVLAAALALGPRRLVAVGKRVDWPILVFFVGLFWLLAGVREQGLSDDLGRFFLGGQAPTLVTLTVWSAVLSNVVSNVPAVILISPTLEPLGSAHLWLALAASSTLAGNATLLGAAANVIVAETARAHGAEFDVKRFTLAGLPVAAATLALMLLLLAR